MVARAIKAGELLVARQYGRESSREPRPQWAVLSREGQGVPALSLFASKQEAEQGLAPISVLQVLPDLVSQCPGGFTIAELSIVASRVTRFESEDEGDAWYQTVSASARDIRLQSEGATLSGGSLFTNRPVQRLMHWISEETGAPGSTADLRAKHLQFMSMAAAQDLVGLRAMMLPNVTLTNLRGTLKGRDAIADVVAYEYQRVRVAKEVGEVTAVDDVSECVVAYWHLTYHVDVVMRERIEWEAGRIRAMEWLLADEQARVKMRMLHEFEEAYQSKFQELFGPGLQYDIITDASEEAEVLRALGMDKPVGAGAFECVRFARKRTDRSVRAIKVISKQLRQKAAVELEISVMRKAMEAMGDLPYVLQLTDTYEGPEDYFLVMELVTGGEVYDRIAAQGSFTEAEAKRLMKQLLSGVERLHAAGILHRDLKPANLLYANQEPSATIKIADFELGCFFKDIFDVYDPVGTPLYMAPELIVAGERCCFDTRGMAVRTYHTYGPSVDVWACGCILFQLLCGQTPFVPVKGSQQEKHAEWDVQDLLTRVRDGEVSCSNEQWMLVSQHAKSLIESMLRVDPRRRPTAAEALAHAWFESEDLSTEPLQHVPEGIAKHQASSAAASSSKSHSPWQRVLVRGATLVDAAFGVHATASKVKAGQLLVTRLHSSATARAYWTVLASEGKGILTLSLFRNEQHAREGLPPADQFEVFPELVGKCPTGFTLARRTIFGQQVTQFESPSDGNAWYTAVTAKPTPTPSTGKALVPQLTLLPRIHDRQMSRSLYKVVKKPVSYLLHQMDGSSDSARRIHVSQRPGVQQHMTYMRMLAEKDRVGLEALMLPDVVLINARGDRIIGRAPVADLLLNHFPRLRMLKETGEVTGDEATTECLLVFWHFIMHVDIVARERLEWKDGLICTIHQRLEEEDAEGKLQILLDMHHDFQSKMQELVREPLPYDIVNNPAEQAKMLRTFEMDNVLGAGAFGTVKLARKKADGSVCAIKSIPRHLQNEEDLRMEISVMRKATEAMGDLPYVVQLYETYEGPEDYFLVMELVTGGEVYDRIAAQGRFTEAEALRLMQQLMSGVARLHTAGILHRDLKPANLLYASKEPNAAIKIADFGLSCFYKDVFDVYDTVGTPMYMAPELILSGPECYFEDQGLSIRNYRTYGPAVDVWACGCILYQLLCGQPPFVPKGLDPLGNEMEYVDRLFARALNGDVSLSDQSWGVVSKPAKRLIKRMLQVSPRKRPTAAAVLEDLWLKSEIPAPTPLPCVPERIAEYQHSLRTVHFDGGRVHESRRRAKDNLGQGGISA